MSLNPADWQGDALGNYNGPRWSYHLARPPAAMYELSDGAVRWWHDNVYDNAALSDPQGYAQKLINDWRAEFVRRGGVPNQTDADVMEYVAAGSFPVVQNTINAWEQDAISYARSAGQTDQSDQVLIDWAATHGLPAPSGGGTYYSGALIPPIPGSDVLNGSANLPTSATSGPASNNAFAVGPGAPATAVNMGAGPFVDSTGRVNWILVAAVAAGVYLLMHHKG
jgi:hypothetical protein